MEDKNNTSWISSIIGLIVVGGVIWFVFNLFQPKSWSLILYSTESPDSEYETDRYDDLDSKDACLIMGQSLSISGGSFECAQGCEFKENFGTEICDRTCDHGGCRE